MKHKYFSQILNNEYLMSVCIAQDGAAADILTNNPQILTQTMDQLLPQLEDLMAGFGDTFTNLMGDDSDQAGEEVKGPDDCTIL